MLSLLVAATCLRSQDFEIDLFLVANNRTAIQGLEWLDKGISETETEALLLPALSTLANKRKPFIVIDGGSILESSSRPQIRLITRLYGEAYPSKTQTIEDAGIRKTRVLERASSVSTGLSMFEAMPFGSNGAIHTNYLYLSGGSNPILIHDLTHTRTSFIAVSPMKEST